MPETAAEAAGAETTLVDMNTVWSYSDSGIDPAGDPAAADYNRTSWTLDGYDDSTWKNNAGAQAKFGAKRGAVADLGNNSVPAVLLNQYKEDGATDIESFFFRTAFTVNEIPENMELTGTLKYDDGVIVYLNGVKIAGFDDTAATGNMVYAGSNAADPIDAFFTVDTANLKTGENVLAVELHQGGSSSSDIYFEMSSLALTKKEEEQPAAVTQKAISLTVGGTSASRRLTWYADSADGGSVQYAAKSGNSFPENYSEAPATASMASDSGFYSYKAVLSGLEANTEYVYRLVNGETVSDIHGFKTAGNGGFSFLLAGDPQVGAGSGVTSDTAGWENTLQKAAASFPNAAFLISAGDQVNTAGNETQYAGYLEHTGLYNLTTATVVGNHDSGSSAYTEHFNNPNVSAYGATAAGSDY